GDTDFDGDHDTTDDTAITGWSTGNGAGGPLPYRAYADVNLDGSIDSSDASAADADSLGWNVLTSDDVNNWIGRGGDMRDKKITDPLDPILRRHIIFFPRLGRAPARPKPILTPIEIEEPCYDPCGCEVG